MQTSDFTTTFLVDRSPAEVFNAINDVRGWWSEEIEGDTNHLDSEWDYHYQDVHKCKMKIVEFVPNKKVVWQVLDNFFSFTKDKHEWKGNRLVFDITQKGDQTELRFTQVGLVPGYECYDTCSNAWNTYINTSLFNLITTGKGEPNSKTEARTEDEKQLSNSNFTTTFFVAQSPQQVFDAINNVRGWWQGEIEGNTDKLGEEFSYRSGEFHFSKQKVIEMVPDEKVAWLVTESLINFVADKEEWKDTKIIFDIKEINNKTQVRFTHVGLVPSIECFGDCSNAWEKLIQESLYSLITVGKGTKVFG